MSVLRRMVGVLGLTRTIVLEGQAAGEPATSTRWSPTSSSSPAPSSLPTPYGLASASPPPVRRYRRRFHPRTIARRITDIPLLGIAARPAEGGDQ